MKAKKWIQAKEVTLKVLQAINAGFQPYQFEPEVIVNKKRICVFN